MTAASVHQPVAGESCLRWDSLDQDASSLATRYQSAAPYPHIALPNFLATEVAERLAADFPPPTGAAWINYKHFTEHKFGQTKRALFPESIGAVIDELNSPRFVDWLSTVTGIDGLLADPTLEGGGMHQTPAGGFLNVHADFTMHHHQPTWRRRCNLIVYLNPHWQNEWGGAIELWDEGMTRSVVQVPPLLNQAVIFNTTDTTYHGYPDPIRCPEGVMRKSIALYYYTAEPAGSAAPRATNYRARPSDSTIRRLAIWADKTAVAAYSVVKRRLGLSDDFASRILSRLSRH
jgi:Rps23 Pro-64 3,4-dihydroxylase Tpa1-like proline 4-hydroxylase